MAEAKNKWLEKPTNVTQEGTQIILPKGMALRQGAEVLLKKAAEEEEPVNIHEEVVCFPLDGAHAFMLALNDIYGWSTMTTLTQQGFFGPREVVPTTIAVETDFEKFTDVFWGGFMVPGLAAKLQTDAVWDTKEPKFIISGRAIKREVPKIKAIADKTREFIKTQSLYKGKALRLTTDDDGNFQPTLPPKFLDLSKVKEQELVFPDHIMEQVRTSLWTPIEKTEQVKALGIPLKRGALLAGPYGTGKTQTAYVTAKKARENGWTFIYLDRVSAFREAMLFARRYAPAVLFAEDIDRILGGERDSAMDDVLNVIDGVDSKNGEIMVILTTNFIEKIDRAMLRPGRLDAVISFSAPDAKAAEQLMRLYGRGLLAAKEDLSEAGLELAGQIPAIIREVMERAKLYALDHLAPGQPLVLLGSDIAAAARGMKHHRDLLNPSVVKVMTPQEQIGHGISAVVDERVDKHLSNGVKSDLTKIMESLGVTR